MKYKINETTWEYHPKYTLDDFVNENQDIYIQQHLERHPEEWHLIDDEWFEAVERRLDYWEVREVMNTLYNEFLDLNK